ncbi:MAG: 2-oxo acid dehydrogenase subunit E2 [Ruminococcaceae bacterium]|nr:2-oxo acid dehydrogenase subunit E2 [Oscillospiraceae bacterium]MBR3596900.1 2-oxo acid dehydrogenase subunit E2 [Clostridia bacterium]
MSFKEYIKTSTLAPEQGDIVEYMSIRDRITSNVLVNSQKEIPGTACSYEADVTALLEKFKELKESVDYKLTFNTLMIKILVEGLKAAPRLNAHYEYNHRKTSGRIIIKKHIDVAMAVCLPDSQTFQVKIKGLEDKNLRETAILTEEVKRKLGNTNLKKIMFNVGGQRILGLALKGKALNSLSQVMAVYFGKGKIAKFSKLFKKKKHKKSSHKAPYDGLKIDDFTEGTVCYTNWGTLYDNLDVNITYIPPLYPQVFLFATGRVKDKEYVYKKEDGTLELGTKKVLPITLVFDHKIGGAADIMPFIKKLDEIFNCPEIIKNW